MASLYDPMLYKLAADGVRPSRHRVFEPRSMGLKPGPAALLGSDPELAYRITRQPQIDDIAASGLVRPREGKASGGRSGEVFWTGGGPGLRYPPQADGTYVLAAVRAGLEGSTAPLEASELKAAYASKNGVWVEVLRDILMQVGRRPAPEHEQGSAPTAEAELRRPSAGAPKFSRAYGAGIGNALQAKGRMEAAHGESASEPLQSRWVGVPDDASELADRSGGRDAGLMRGNDMVERLLGRHRMPGVDPGAFKLFDKAPGSWFRYNASTGGPEIAGPPAPSVAGPPAPSVAGFRDYSLRPDDSSGRAAAPLNERALAEYKGPLEAPSAPRDMPRAGVRLPEPGPAKLLAQDARAMADLVKKVGGYAKTVGNMKVDGPAAAALAPLAAYSGFMDPAGEQNAWNGRQTGGSAHLANAAGTMGFSLIPELAGQYGEEYDIAKKYAGDPSGYLKYKTDMVKALPGALWGSAKNMASGEGWTAGQDMIDQEGRLVGPTASTVVPAAISQYVQHPVDSARGFWDLAKEVPGAWRNTLFGEKEGRRPDERNTFGNHLGQYLAGMTGKERSDINNSDMKYE